MPVNKDHNHQEDLQPLMASTPLIYMTSSQILQKMARFAAQKRQHSGKKRFKENVILF